MKKVRITYWQQDQYGRTLVNEIIDLKDLFIVLQQLQNPKYELVAVNMM